MASYVTDYIALQTNDLGSILGAKTASTVVFPSNTTTIQKESISYSEPTIILETDIVATMDGYPLNGDQVLTFGPAIQNQYILSLYQTTITGNTLAFSNNGIDFYGLGGIFSGALASGSFFVSYNGRIWLTGGDSASNTMGYSYDGRTWVGLGMGIFSGYAKSAAWNGTLWVASGTGTNSLAYSYDGINWVGLGTAIVTNASQAGDVVWNGRVFLAGAMLTAIGSGIFAAYSFNGINWTSLNTSSFPGVFTNTVYTWCLVWDGLFWRMGGGSGTTTHNYWYTSDPTGATGWTGGGYIGTASGHMYAMGFNGKVLIGAGNTSGWIGYSYDGRIWVTRTGIICNNQGRGTIWDGVKFISTGSGGTSYIGHSLNGVDWSQTNTNPSGGSGFNLVYGANRQHTITYQRNLTIAAGQGTHSLAFSHDGITWTGLGTTVFTTRAICVEYNGRIWVAGGEGGNTLAFSKDGITWTGLGSYIIDILVFSIAWNGSIWVATGRGTKTLAYSYDGMTWLTSSSSESIYGSTSTLGGQTVIWTGTLWVVIGGGNGNSIAYSTDGINWTGVSSATVGISGLPRTIGTNGQILIAGGDASDFNGTGIYYSYDAQTWTSLGRGIMSTIRGVAWNGTMFVIVGRFGNTTAYSYDGITWTGGTNIFSTVGLSVCWNGTMWVGVGNNNIAYSYNGITWTATTNPFTTIINGVASNYQVPPKAFIQHPTIAFGTGGNTMAYSPDGINWTNLGTSVFSSQGRRAFWNGSIWVGCGQGENTLAYSYDGYNWRGLGNSIFSSQAFSACYNGSIWVAVGEGTNTIAYSINGLTWTGVSNSTQIFTSFAIGVAWNGRIFLATGNSGNSMATSTNGITWAGVSSTTMYASVGANFAASSGPLWVATINSSVGMVYTTDITAQTGWTTVTSPFSNAGISVCWNGAIWVALGNGSVNTLAWSNDGINWTGLARTIFPTVGYDVCWNGTRFVAAGTNGGTQGRLGYSADGITWYSIIAPFFSTFALGVASNPGVGAFIAPSAMVLDNNGISGNGIAKSQTLDIVSSDNYYQTGFDNMSVTVSQSSIYNKLITSTYSSPYLNPQKMLYAFSVRVVVSTYNGPVFNLRRSSDNATSDFYTNATQSYLTTGANGSGTTYATWIGANTAYVVTWYDQSGRGNHCTQSNTTIQPTISLQNSKYVVTFNNTTGTYFNLTTASQPNTIFCQFTNSNTNFGSIICSNADFSQRFGQNSGININGQSNANDWYFSQGVPKFAYNNGVSATTVLLSNWNSLALSTTSTVYTLGSFTKVGTDGFSTARGMNGYMAEMIGHNIAMTITDASAFYRNRLI